MVLRSHFWARAIASKKTFPSTENQEIRMHVITRKRLNEFAARYPETKTALAQ
ncbi:MAG: hypothetical protein QNJ72_31410 [Pleurocapsa sp. MO_226.B13]|nr:hypothetical protein [Pleurocapsa sp. MO_226.B13]